MSYSRKLPLDVAHFYGIWCSGASSRECLPRAYLHYSMLWCRSRIT